MGQKVEFLLQISQDQGPFNGNVLIVVGIVIIVAISAWWQYNVNREFSEAKLRYKLDPANQGNRQKLISAARLRGDYAYSVLEVVSLLDHQPTSSTSDILTKERLVGELQSLAELHKKGALTDQEFEQAKAKLLNS